MMLLSLEGYVGSSSIAPREAYGAYNSK